jgi:ribonuclease P protein component
MASSSGCAPTGGARYWPAAAAKDGSASPSEVLSLDQRFPRHHRLTARKQFLAVYAEGCRVASTSFTLFGMPNGEQTCRLGITVSRRIGKATRRNRVKRVLREVFRTHRARLAPPLDLVINTRQGIEVRTKVQLEEEFVKSFRRLAGRFER